MKEIIKQVKNCEKCKELDFCKKSGMSPAVMTSRENAKFFFVGQQPSHFQEKEVGLEYNDVVYASPIGVRFYQPFLKKMNLNYNDIYISNLVKCSSKENISPKEEWANNCFPILQQQINKLPNLKYIVLLGSFVRDYIKKHPLKTNAKIVLCKHPAYFMRTGALEKGIDELCSKLRTAPNNKEIIQIQTKFSNIYEFYRENGIKKMREIDFENYFYVKSEDMDAVIPIIMEESRNKDFQTKLGYVSIYGDKLCKIIPNKFEYWKFRKILKAKNIPTFEAFLDVDLKYLLDRKSDV